MGGNRHPIHVLRAQLPRAARQVRVSVILRVTVSALTHCSLDRIDAEGCVRFILSCQNSDGGFGCVPGAESHAVSSRSSLFRACGKPSFERTVPKNGAFIFIHHAAQGQVFCCTAALAICGALDAVDGDRLGWWLAARQVDGGGLNGRPEKLPDVCYSWWVLSSLAILRRLHWIDNEALSAWILQCQDEEKGGIADRCQLDSGVVNGMNMLN